MKRRALSALVSWLVAAPILLTSASAYCQSNGGTLGTINVYGTVPGGSGSGAGGGAFGGGGGGWGGASTTVEEEEDHTCAILAAQAEPGCDLRNPPPIIVNGCGSGWNTIVVPDGMPGNWSMFEDSCNTHDYCYANSSDSKQECDSALRADMYVDCDREYLTGTPAGFLLWTDCRARADMYEAVLSSGVGSNGAFDQGRFEMRCRALSAEYLDYGCL